METQEPKILPRRWTNAELDELRSLYPSQFTAYVARQMGRTYASVHGKALKLRLSKLRSICDIDNVVKETITVVAVSNQISQSNIPDVMRRESYVQPPWAFYRDGADDHLKYKSRGF
jgi:hypothetical protein